MRSGFVALVALVCGCGRIGFEREADVPMLRKPITITAGSVSLADYPLAVIDTGDADLAAGASGDDLAFVAADGVTPLAYEIDSYDAGSLVAWVRVPIVTGTETIYLTYGGPAHAPPDPAPVWPDMLGVWHFADVGPASDSTSHAHTFDSMTPPASVAGIAGGARSFDGTTTLAIAVRPTAVSTWACGRSACRCGCS